jgi:hypothetical protein
MFIIPYVETMTEINNIPVTIYRILMVGGTALWEEMNAPLSEIESLILHPNDIYLSSMPRMLQNNNSYILCPVDTKKTRLGDYYMWDEITEDDSETFCWRTFYMFGKNEFSCENDIMDNSDINILFRAMCLSHLNANRDI